MKIISFLSVVIKSNKPQIENEAEGDKTEESENSGKAVSNMFKVACRVQIWKKNILSKE